MRFALICSLIAALILFLLALIPDQGSGGTMARTQRPTPRLTDKEFNAIVTAFLGGDRQLRVSYQGGAKNWEPSAGIATFNVNRIHLRPKWYKAIRDKRVSPQLLLGMGVLAHEVGHYSPDALNYVLRGGTPNGNGGMDYDVRIPENMADEYAYANMRRLYNMLGFRPHQARTLSRKSIRSFKKFRSEHQY